MSDNEDDIFNVDAAAKAKATATNVSARDVPENTPPPDAEILVKQTKFVKRSERKFYAKFDYKQKPRTPKVVRVIVKKVPSPEDSQPSVSSHFKPEPRKPTVRKSPRNPSPSISPIRGESKKVDPLEPPRKSRQLQAKKSINYTEAFETSPAFSANSEQNEVEFCVPGSPELQDSQN